MKFNSPFFIACGAIALSSFALSAPIESSTPASHPYDLELLENMIPDVASKIFDQMWSSNPSNVFNLIRSSSRGRNLARKLNYSPYSEIGSVDKIVEDPTLCDDLVTKPDILKTIRNLHVNWRVYQRCGFNSNMLPNLQLLFVKLEHNDQNATPSFQDMAHLWNNLQQEHHKLKSLDLINANGQGLLHLLMKDPQVNDRLEQMQTLLSKTLLDASLADINGITPLHLCMLNKLEFNQGNPQLDIERCVQILLSHGADPHSFSDTGITPVHLAVLLNDKKPLEALLNAGANVDIETRPYRAGEAPISPLMYASSWEDWLTRPEFLVRQVLAPFSRHPVHMEMQDVDPVFQTERAASLDSQQLPAFALFSRGADLTKTDGINCAFMTAIAKLPDTLVEAMLSLPVERLPLHGANPIGISPLHFAARRRGLSVIRKMVELGANINAATEDQRPVLEFAINEGNCTEKVKYLIQQGAHLSYTYKFGSPKSLMSSLARVLSTFTSTRFLPADQDKLLVLDAILDHMPSTDEDRQVRYFHDIDYHLLTSVTLSLNDPALIQRLLIVLPERIKRQFDLNELQQGRMMLTQDGEAELKEIYKRLVVDAPHHQAKWQVLTSSRSLLAFLEEIDGTNMNDVLRFYHGERHFVSMRVGIHHQPGNTAQTREHVRWMMRMVFPNSDVDYVYLPNSFPMSSWL